MGDPIIPADQWTLPDFSNLSPDLAASVCFGTGTVDCLRSNPGVYVGIYGIPATGGILGHTAIATVTQGDYPKANEFVGWDRIPPFTTPAHYLDQIKTLEDTPYYADWGVYSWVKIAGTDRVQDATNGISSAEQRFSGQPFAGTSNVVTSFPLYCGGLTIDASLMPSLSPAPGLNLCGIVVN